MNTTRRLTATILATAALAAPSALATTAAAKPDKPTTGKSQTKQLLKDIAGKDKRLDRLSTSNAVTRLADDTEAEIVLNVTDARAQLGEARTTVEAADSTFDTRAARKELRSFRVENLRIVVSIVSKVERMEEAAAADPEALAYLAAAEAAALQITPSSTKADIRTARSHLQSAAAELEAEAEAD